MNTPVYDRLLALLEPRVAEGYAKYGTPLKPYNGRDALMDAWEEAADLLFYLTQMLMEREDQR